MRFSRRDFLGTSTAALLAALVADPLHGSAPPRRRELAELRRGVGVFSARGGTIGWLLNRGGAVVVDSQYPDTAARCLAALREREMRGIDALINSHHHGDHTAGNGVFRDAAARIVAHRRAVELQRTAAQAAAAQTTVADTTFEEEWALTVGDETVTARHYGAAHTGGDCTIAFERANVVHMGDLVFNRTYPFVDRAGGASVLGWIALLETVVARHDADTIYVFGHGNPRFGISGGRADVLAQRDFLSAALAAVERAVAAGQGRAEATSHETLAGFEDYIAPAERLTLAAVLGAVYDEVSAR
jgi:cyclase